MGKVLGVTLATLAALMVWWLTDVAPPPAPDGHGTRLEPASGAPDPRATDAPLSAAQADPTAGEADPALRELQTIATSGDRHLMVMQLNELVARARAGDGNALRLLALAARRFPAGQQAYLVAAVARVATPEALNSLLDLGRDTEATVSAARQAAREEIGDIGANLDEQGEFQAKLSPPLERQLPDALTDPDWLDAIASGIASVGTEAGVEALLNAAEQQPGSPAAKQIETALNQVRNPAATAPLARRLASDPTLRSSLTAASAKALATISAPAATEALLAWAVRIDDARTIETARTLLTQLADAESFELLQGAVNQRSFQNPRMQVAARRALAAMSGE